jgi:hypothetical protein
MGWLWTYRYGHARTEAHNAKVHNVQSCVLGESSEVT